MYNVQFRLADDGHGGGTAATWVMDISDYEWLSPGLRVTVERLGRLAGRQLDSRLANVEIGSQGAVTQPLAYEIGD